MKPPVTLEAKVVSLLSYIDHKTLQKAAKANYLDSASISQRITWLEGEYGRLLKRNKHGQRLPILTVAGEEFLKSLNYKQDIYGVWTNGN